MIYIYIYMYACMYVCMYVYIHIYTIIHNSINCIVSAKCSLFAWLPKIMALNSKINSLHPACKSNVFNCGEDSN